MTAVRFLDTPDGFESWIHPEPAWMERASSAVLAGGGVWVLDPADGDGVEERIRALGKPAGVVQMLDRHDRDCAALAERLGVPHHRVPRRVVPGAPFDVIRVVDIPTWREVSLHFPRERILACADVLAAGPGYSAPNERVGVHPWLRAVPPRKLGRLDVDHLLLGHGEGVHGPEANVAVGDALRASLRNLPAYGIGQVQRLLGR